VIADLVEAEDIHATIVSFDFDVAIPGSIPLIDNFDYVDPTLAPTKTSGQGCTRINLKAHESTVR
jgi:hypothetical protein